MSSFHTNRDKIGVVCDRWKQQCLLFPFSPLVETSTALDQSRLRGDVVFADAADTLPPCQGATNSATRAGCITRAWFIFRSIATSRSRSRQAASPVHGNPSTKTAPPRQSPIPFFCPCWNTDPPPKAPPPALPSALALLRMLPMLSWRIWHGAFSAMTPSARPAVRFADGTLMAAFYEAGEINESGGRILAAEQPCIVLASVPGVFVSDPLRTGHSCGVSVYGKRHVIVCPADGDSHMNSVHDSGR